MQVSPSDQASLLPLLTDTTTSAASHVQPPESSPSFPEPHAIPSQPASHQSHDPTQPIPIPSRCGQRIIVEATEATIESTKRKRQSHSELEARVAALEEESRFQRQLIELYGMHVDMARLENDELQAKLNVKDKRKDKNADPTMNVGEIRWLTGPDGKAKRMEAQEGRAAKRWKKEDAEAKKSEAESARAARRFKFMNGEVVYSGNVTTKKVDELRDICWALGQNDEGTKDVLIATIKSQLAHPHVQNNLKLAGLYIGRRPATNENQPPQSPLAFPPPAPAHRSLILQTISLCYDPTS